MIKSEAISNLVTRTTITDFLLASADMHDERRDANAHSELIDSELVDHMLDVFEKYNLKVVKND